MANGFPAAEEDAATSFLARVESGDETIVERAGTYADPDDVFASVLALIEGKCATFGNTADGTTGTITPVARGAAPDMRLFAVVFMATGLEVRGFMAVIKARNAVAEVHWLDSGGDVELVEFQDVTNRARDRLAM